MSGATKKVGVALALAIVSASLAGPAARAQLASTPPPPTPVVDSTVLTLIGTQGGPGLTVRRAGESSLLTIRGKRYLIDAGIGVTRRLAEANVPLPSISEVFITHQHNDHTAGLFALLTLYSNRAGIEVIGPPRTVDFVNGALALARINWEIRAQQGGVGAARLYQKRCEGCRLELNITELNEVRAAPPTQVVRCENCRRILIRTSDSGL